MHTIGLNWIRTDLSTDEDTNFEIEVNPGSSFKLAAYNYKDKYAAAYNDIIPAVASGDIVGNQEELFTIIQARPLLVITAK